MVSLLPPQEARNTDGQSQCVCIAPSPAGSRSRSIAKITKTHARDRRCSAHAGTESPRPRDRRAESRTRKCGTQSTRFSGLVSHTPGWLVHLFYGLIMGHTKNTSTTYIYQVGPRGLEGPVRLHSSHPRPGPGWDAGIWSFRPLPLL
jgi:hypothetical protein